MIEEQYLETARQLPRTDFRLGRTIVHDRRSRAFARATTIDQSTWNSRKIRIYDPIPNPNQCHGECTCCAQCMLLNTVGERKKGQVLNMDTAHKLYSLATSIDPFPGSWTDPTWDDTGSSGLAAATASQTYHLGATYNWLFGGADETVQTVVNGRTVSIGTAWYQGMFYPDSNGFIEPTGPLAGGHQYIARGYNESKDAIVLRCWWGDFRDVLIKRDHLNDLVMDDGDQHTQDIFI
jgi:hypothetical protein